MFIFMFVCLIHSFLFVFCEKKKQGVIELYNELRRKWRPKLPTIYETVLQALSKTGNMKFAEKIIADLKISLPKLNESTLT